MITLQTLNTLDQEVSFEHEVRFVLKDKQGQVLHTSPWQDSEDQEQLSITVQNRVGLPVDCTVEIEYRYVSSAIFYGAQAVQV